MTTLAQSMRLSARVLVLNLVGGVVIVALLAVIIAVTISRASQTRAIRRPDTAAQEAQTRRYTSHTLQARYDRFVIAATQDHQYIIHEQASIEPSIYRYYLYDGWSIVFVARRSQPNKPVAWVRFFEAKRPLIGIIGDNNGYSEYSLVSHLADLRSQIYGS